MEIKVQNNKLSKEIENKNLKSELRTIEIQNKQSSDILESELNSKNRNIVMNEYKIMKSSLVSNR